MRRERGQRVDPAEAPEPCDGRPPPLVARQLREPLARSPPCASVSPSTAASRSANTSSLAGSSNCWQRASGGARPSRSSASDRPGRDAAASSRRDDGRFIRSRRQASWAASSPAPPRPPPAGPQPRQRAGQQQPCEQLGVLAIGLDSIGGTPRRLARRDHLHLDPGRRRRPIEPEPGRAGLITRPHRARQPRQPRHRPLEPGPNRARVSSPVIDVDRRRMRRTGMDIKPHPRHRSGHGRTSSLSGVSRSHSPARQTPARSVRPTNPGSQPTGRPRHRV